MWKRQAAQPKPSRNETLERLKSVLASDSSSAQTDSANWDDLEPNPWKSADRETLLTFPAEDPLDRPELDEPTSEPSEKDTAGDDDLDSADSKAAVAAFHAAVSEARKDAEAQLAEGVEKMRKAVVEEHAAEIARLADRHAEELEQTRETTEAEVSQRVREEESQRHALEIVQVREHLTRRYTDNLQRAQAAVVDSFKGLTSNISGSF